MEKKDLKKIVALKDLKKIEEEVVKAGYTLAKKIKKAGEVGLVELFQADEVCVSPNVRTIEKYFQIAIYDNVKGGEKWEWLVVFEEKKFNQSRIPSAIKIYVKEK